MALLSYRGTRDEPLPDDWFGNEPDLIGGFGVSRSRQPEIGVGEGVIWYATRWPGACSAPRLGAGALGHSSRLAVCVGPEES